MTDITTYHGQTVTKTFVPRCASCNNLMVVEKIDEPPSHPDLVVRHYKCEECGEAETLPHGF